MNRATHSRRPAPGPAMRVATAPAMVRAWLSLIVVAGAALAVPAPAVADLFGPISLVSESSSEQALYAHDPVISGNGQYVAFDGYFDGQEGVWRKDLQTGAVEAVAAVPTGGAEGPPSLPSISENGQYVSFTTTARLAPVYDSNEDPDVYVRNMAIPAAQPCAEYTPEELAADPPPTLQECAFTLVSAVSGAPTGLAYDGAKGAHEEPGYGALASGRSALSADGKEVAFVTTAYSDLTSGQAAQRSTPPLQVVVRNLATEETQLVSVQRSPTTGEPEPGEPVSAELSNVIYGAVYSPAQGPPYFPDTSRAYGMTPAVGASISADGSTVTWMGADVSKQAAMLRHEQHELRPSYAEPLWRRISEGPQAPTRRVTGGSEPQAPACIASGELELGELGLPTDPCQGPFQIVNQANGIFTSEDQAVPQLSANGMTVAFLATAPPVARGNDFGLSENAPTDLYVADMQEGLTRAQALRPLTQFSGTGSGEAYPIIDLAISASGQQVAFTTKRTVFVLPSLTYVTAPMAVAGMSELFDIDLGDGTLTRVTHGYEGAPGEHPHPTAAAGSDPYKGEDGALSPSFSTDGETIAFSSTASNFAYGDGNTPAGDESLTFDGSDAFVVSRIPYSSTPTPQSVSTYPANPTLTPAWRLGATAHTTGTGTVELYVALPGAGQLSAVADSAVVVGVAHSSRSARHGSDRGATSARRPRAAGRSHSMGHAKRSVAVVLTRPVAQATLSEGAAEGAVLMVPLAIAPAYRKLAAQQGGLPATVYLTFTAAGHPTLHERVAVTFVITGRGARRRHVGAATARRPGVRR